MKIETKITERDKKLLVFLAVFLIVVGFTMLIIVPGIQSISALSVENVSSTLTKEEMDAKIEKLPILTQELEDKKAEWAEMNGELFGMMASQDIDKIVTDEVTSCGLNMKSLNIVMNEELGELSVYGEIQEEESTEAADETEDEVNSGIHSASVSLSVEGSQDRISMLTDRFADYTAVRVTSMKYDTNEVVDDAGLVKATNTVLNLEMEFYMCEK